MPLDAAEAAELLAVLRSRTPARARRLAQGPTDPDLLVPTGTIRQLLAAERAASSVAHDSTVTLAEPVGPPSPTGLPGCLRRRWTPCGRSPRS